MKKALKYIIILAVSAVLTLGYGFCIGGEFNLWISFTVFTVSMVILMIFDRKPTNKKFGERFFIILLTAFCVLGISIVFYNAVNESSVTLQDTYEAEIVDVMHIPVRGNRGLSILYFNSPEGEEHHIFYAYWQNDLNEKITFEEYIGLFDKTFCVRKK